MVPWCREGGGGVVWCGGGGGGGVGTGAGAAAGASGDTDGVFDDDVCLSQHLIRSSRRYKTNRHL